MKYLIALFLIATSLRAEPKAWTNVLIDRGNLSPVDEIVIGQFPTTDKVHKLSHPDVSTVKIYLGTANSKTVYVVWKWKPLPSGWEIMDTSNWNSETKLAKGIPFEFLDHLNLQDRPLIDYGVKYKKNLPKINRTKVTDGQGSRKGYMKFDADSIEAINNFHLGHNVKFSTYSPIGTGSGYIYLFYDDGNINQKVTTTYQVDNE